MGCRAQTLTFSSGTAEEEETRRLPLLRIAQAISPRSLTALATLNLNDLFLFATAYEGDTSCLCFEL